MRHQGKIVGIAWIAVIGLALPAQAGMKDLLNPGQIDGLMARRDKIVAFYDAKIAAVGEDKVLYDLETTFTGTEATPP